MMPAHWLMREGYPLRLYMERPRHISRFLARQFDTDGPMGQRKLFISRKTTPAEAAGSILRAVRVLNAGMVLMIAGDVRWPGANSTEALFLGRSYSFSNTWVKLATLTAAPIVPVFCRIDDDGAYQLDFLPPYTLPRGTPEPEQVVTWVQDYLRTIEAEVERYPANSNEYFFWGDAAKASSESGAVLAE
jgi:KDO2-lipid IV(A) lauroyltransferase